MPTENKIPVIYVAGPYRAATRELIAENIAVARSVAVSTARLGWFPICPHTNTAHFDDDLPDQDQFFLDGTLALMERCDAVVLTMDGDTATERLARFTERVNLASLSTRASPTCQRPPNSAACRL